MDDVRQRLIDAALAARERAYAPYSRFAVGAAVLDEHGRIHAGCNVENAAYPQGWCAETSALAALRMAGAQRALAVAVAADSAEPCTPCGGCRQRIREFAAGDCPIHVAGPAGWRASYRLDELLPASFGPGHIPGDPAGPGAVAGHEAAGNEAAAGGASTGG